MKIWKLEKSDKKNLEYFSEKENKGYQAKKQQQQHLFVFKRKSFLDFHL